MDKKGVRVLHVVSSTHWDREWYYTFQEFRVQLVDLMDSLLALMDEDPGFWRFMLDGQTAPVEDYLEVRPEKAPDIEKHTRGGQLQLGPYYVLADEWLCSPESHIRNVQIGCAIARRFGGEMRVAYLPDVFGHISQMPQILNGFGFDATCISRGTLLINTSSQLWWTSPDGSKVLAHAQGYGNAANAFRRDETIEAIDTVAQDLAPRTKTGCILLMNSGDHMEPVRNLPQLIEEYRKARPDKIVHSTLSAFIENVKKSDLRGIPEVTGELRDGLRASAANLYDCISSRIYNKQAAQKCNDALERWAEPFAGIAALLGAQHPGALLWQAWKYLIQNCAHDSICGCSIDRVHDQMMTRFEWTEEIAEKLTGRAFDFISARAGMGKIPDEAIRITVWNPSTRSRSGAVHVVLDDRIGSGYRAAPRKWPKRAPVCVVDPKGRRIAAQPVPAQVDKDLGVTLTTMWSHGTVNPRALVFWADDVPALGYRVYGVIPEKVKIKTPLQWGADWAENEFVKLKIAANGSIAVEDKTSGAGFTGLGLFEDGGDRGGAYQFKPPEKDIVVTSKEARAKVDLVDSGPALVRFRVELTMRVPERLNAKRTARVSKTVPLKIVSYVTLGVESRSLHVRTFIWNNAVDHRLRVVFPTGLKADNANVDGHFDVLDRAIGMDKKPWPTEHQRRWVDLSDGTKGLAVINYGLPEYEATGDKTRTIKLTLFRSNTYVQKEWWPTLMSPQAEMRGKSDYEYSIYAHAGDWKTGSVMAEAESATLPLKAHIKFEGGSWPTTGELPPESSFISVESPRAVTSIVKKADGRDSLVIRLYNPDKAQTPAVVKARTSIRQAYILDLEENRKRETPLSDGELKLWIPAKKIVTLELTGD